MCGIAGAFGGLSAAQMRDAASGVIQEISYRGPDGHATEYFDNGFLLHLRLAIIDLSAGGSQPKWSDDKRYCLIFNGEIYNYIELREDLKSDGYAFSTESDSEVLLKVWQIYGPRGLSRCIGMYALAILDVEESVLFLARDTYGIKPLYVMDTGKGLRFASSHAALARFPDCSNKVNPAAAYRFVRYGTLESAGETLVDGIRTLLPGAVEVWSVVGQNPTLKETIQIPVPEYRVTRSDLSFTDAAEELRERFLESVRLHLRSDVPLGFALSGGIDSSAILCASRLLEPDATLKAFTYSARGHKWDETRWADIASNHAKAESHHVMVSSGGALETLEQTVRFHGPTAASGVAGQLNVFRVAHEAGIKVMLDGQGSDETFGGYHFYIGAALAGYVKRAEWGKAAQLVASSDKVPSFGSSAAIAWGLDHLLPPRLQSVAREVAGRAQCPRWIDRDWLDDRAPGVVRDGAILSHTFGKDVLADRLEYDLTDRILPNLLQYEDRNSMYYSIESRVPFLSSLLTDFAYSVPSSYHLGPDGITKRLLRESMRGILPEEIRLRKDKIGMGTPQGDWLFAEREQIHDLLDSEHARSIRLFDHETLMSHWRAIDGPDHPDFKFVWRWMGLILWTETFQIDWA